MIQGLEYGAAQDRGRRPYQEDSFHIEPVSTLDGATDGLLMAMADGMGGHRGGAEASAAAIEAFVDAYVGSSEPEAERLNRGLLAANERIAREVDANPTLHGMGCTLLAVSLTPAGLHLISVGDSPAFLFRDGELTRLNADHSMAPVLRQAVAMGTLSQEEMECHPHRNSLRSVVVGQELRLIDLREEPVTLLAGDKLLLASDGILTLPSDRITQLLSEESGRTAEQLCGLLVKAVTEADNPHQDNVTVLIAAMPRGAEAEQIKKPPPPAGRLAPARRVLAAAWPLVLRPGVLASLGAGFLLAAVAVGAGTWLREHWRNSPPAMPAASAEAKPNSVGRASDQLSAAPAPTTIIGGDKRAAQGAATTAPPIHDSNKGQAAPNAAAPAPITPDGGTQAAHGAAAATPAPKITDGDKQTAHGAATTAPAVHDSDKAVAPEPAKNTAH